ncbi:acyl-CoA N-acyltransferase [Dactylonectria estremocensis]|uniref:Acyl-CoA N-acyltransferase n=1 Tax=Dactylonectria estremocensis TaxID=1079267 RepID=A0A9P9DCQ4_9HYPO|nr:acyl-CoA N-acyltransferase [Dactylonectria estremocensis]
MAVIEAKIRKAQATESSAIIDLSARVQEALESSGSQQVFGPLQRKVVESAILNGFCYVFECVEDLVGAVIVSPMAADCLYLSQLQNVDDLGQPFWVLESLMIEPSHQGKGLGLHLLTGITEMYRPLSGAIFLDCWAGNVKLRHFYRRAGFKELGDVPEENYYITIFAKSG